MINKIISTIILVFYSNCLLAEIGTITKVMGTDAIIIRDTRPINAKEGFILEEGDRIETKNSILLVHFFPSTQINLSKDTVFTIDEHEVTFEDDKELSEVFMSFLHGKIKVLVEKLESSDTTTQTIQTKNVAIGVRGTEFDVEENDNETNIDVIEGKVSASTDEESVELKPEDSIQIKRYIKNQLQSKVKRRQRLISHGWVFAFINSDKAKQKWLVRRTDVRKKFLKMTPAERKKFIEERRQKRLENRKKRKLLRDLNNQERPVRPRRNFKR